MIFNAWPLISSSEVPRQRPDSSSICAGNMGRLFAILRLEFAKQLAFGLTGLAIIPQEVFETSLTKCSHLLSIAPHGTNAINS